MSKNNLKAENEHRKKKLEAVVNNLHLFCSSACPEMKMEMRQRKEAYQVVNSKEHWTSESNPNSSHFQLKGNNILIFFFYIAGLSAFKHGTLLPFL